MHITGEVWSAKIKDIVLKGRAVKIIKYNNYLYDMS